MPRQKIKRALAAAALSALTAVSFTGCVYVRNQSWDDLTPEEQWEALSSFERERDELEEEWAKSPDSAGSKLERAILDLVGRALHS